MADHSPTEVARLLGVKEATLRKYAQEYAAFLSPQAAVSGPTARRRYQDSDIALLRTIQAQLRHGATHEQVRARLGGNLVDNIHEVEDAQTVEDKSENFSYLPGVVTVLDQQPEVQALRQILDAQRATLEAQQAVVAAQTQVIDQQRAQLDAFERGLAQAHQEIDDTRADLAGQLADVRGQVERLPRWLRVLLGLA